MKNGIRKTIWRTGKVFLLFTGCTLFFYAAILLIQNEYEKRHRYDPPEGAAIKVDLLYEEVDNRLLKRLMLFYLDGEL